MKPRGFLVRKCKDWLLRGYSAFAAAAAAAVMLWILWTVCAKGFGIFSWSFFTNPSRPYGSPEVGGIANAILGSLMVTGMAMVLAVPAAIAAGIFLAEYPEVRRYGAWLRFAANVMMGMPSVLVGLFVYVVLVVPMGCFSGFAAAVALAMLMFPVVMRTTEDMLGMVPATLRESALALGMSRTRATLCIVCRAAKSGLLTGVLLALARVCGETAPLLFTAMYADAWPGRFFTEPTANLPVLITEYSTNSPFESMHRMGWGAALAVTAGVLLVNVSARVLFREKKV